jgi:hypothetical protein
MKHWTIAEARRSLSALLRAAAHEPQSIYNRDRLVAGVVAPEHLAEVAVRRSIADAFDELRVICREESYRPLLPPRRNRRNPFADR